MTWLVCGFVAYTALMASRELDSLLASIDSVEPTHNPLSSPACSFDRLRLRYGRRSVMISPLDKQSFVEALAQQRPELRRIDC